MALHVPRAPGISQMLKDGVTLLSGLEESVLRNIDACRELSRKTRTSYGPNGQNKMVINHLEKLFVTNDAATILKELEVEHPAAKMLVMASQQQEMECGDGTNIVLVFAGALLDKAEELIRMGISIPDIVRGYELALKKSQEIMPSLVIGEVKDLLNKADVQKVIKSAIMSKQYGSEDYLADLITDACISITSDGRTFNVDSVRVCKIAGSGISASSVVQGMVFKRQVEGNISKAEKTKVAVYSCALDIMQTETKGTVLIKTAQELLNYSKGEETQVEEQIKKIAESGCKVAVSASKIGDLVMHYCDKYGIMVVRINSKFDLRRLCKTIGATALPQLVPPTPEETGYCDHVYVDEIGDTPVIVFKQDKKESSVATILIRGATDNIMDDVERAVDDGVNTYKALTRDARYVPGAGATEIELAKQLISYSEACPGVEQYAITKFAEALEGPVRAIAENTGLKATDVIAKLYASHQEGHKNFGVDIESTGSKNILDAKEAAIFDLFMSKFWALKFATAATCTILKVDQIIMAKAAGGPKPKENPAWDDD